MIKEFSNGLHQDNLELQEDYLDWFFLSYYSKGPAFWRNLPDDKITAYMTLESEKEKRYWDTWIKIYSKIYGK